MAALASLFVKISADDRDVVSSVARVRSSLTSLDRQKVQPKVSLPTGLDAEVKGFQSKLQSLGRQQVKLAVDASTAKADVSTLGRQLETLQRQRHTVPVSMAGEIDRQIDQVQRDLLAASRRQTRIPLQLERVDGQIASVKASLAGLEKTAVDIPVDVDRRGAVASKFAQIRSSVTGLGGAMTAALGAAGVGRVLTDTVTKAGNFEAAMKQVGVATGATGPALKTMTDLALRMGKETTFSAQGAADAMLELARGGLTQAQIKAGALQATLTLAAAGGLELGNASTYVVQGLTTFGLSADKAGTVAAALAGGANASTASVESMGQALSQVGPGAKIAGLSIQETTAALAAFDNAGLKGSDAGTSLKTMLTRLVPSTAAARSEMSRLGIDFTNADGSFKSLTEIAAELQGGLAGLSAEQKTTALATMFGSDATRAASIIAENGAAGIGKLIKATSDQGAAQDLAKSKTEGFKGAMEAFKGSVETLQIQLGTKLLPVLTSVLGWLATDGYDAAVKFGSALGSVRDFVQDHFVPVVGVLAAAFAKFAVGPALAAIGSALSGLGGAIAAMGGPLSALRIAFAAIGGPVTVIVAGLAMLYAKSETFRGAVNALLAPLRGLGGVISDVFGGRLGEAAEGLGRMGGQIAAAAREWIPKLWAALTDAGRALVDWIGPRVGPALSALAGLLGRLAGWIVGTGLPMLAGAATRLGAALIGWVSAALPPLLGDLGKLVGGAVGWIVGTGLPRLVAGAAKLGVALVGWVLPRLPGLLADLAKFAAGAVAYLASTVLPALVKGAVALGVGMIQGLVGAFSGTVLGNALGGAAKTAWAAVTAVFTAGIGAVKATWSAFWGALQTAAASAFGAVKSAIDAVWTGIKSAFTAAQGAVSAAWSAYWAALKAVAGSVFTAIKDAINTTWGVVKAIFANAISAVKAAWSAYWTALKATASTMFTAIKDAINATWSAIKTLFANAITAVKSAWSAFWTALKTTASTTFTAIKDAINGTWSTVKTIFSNAITAVKSAWSSFWTALKTTASTTFTAIKDTISGTWSTVKSIFTNGTSAVKSTWNTFWGAIKSTASDAMGAVKSGIDTALGKIKDAFGTAKTNIGRVWDGVKGVVAAPINWIKDNVYNKVLVPVWNRVAGLVGGTKLAGFADGGIVGEFARGGIAGGYVRRGIADAERFANGGVDRGPAHGSRQLTGIRPARGPHGIRPGYTPGRDTHIIAVGGGEAIMRPEWTRAAGAEYVHGANRAARQGGVAGAKAFIEKMGMPRGFARGGVAGGAPLISPQFGVPGYGLGDVVRSVTNVARSAVSAIGGVASSIKGWVIGGLKAAASAAFAPIRALIRSHLSGSPVKSTIGAIANRAIDLVLAKIGAADAAAMPPGGSFGASGSSPNGVGGLGPRAAAARAYVIRTFGITNIGGYSYRNIAGTNTLSDHALGKAIDVMTTNIPLGNRVAAAFVNGARTFGTKYVIWQQAINSGSGWRRMADRGSPTQNHRDHVHVSFYNRGGVAGELPGLADGGLVRGGRGGITARIGEGRHDELVAPLPKGWQIGNRSDKSIERLIALIEEGRFGGAHFDFTTYNPVAEPQSVTTNRALQRVSALGLVG